MTKYKKGTFIIVPNIKHLRGRPTEYVALFLWLCSYANDSGTCFPSRKQLADDCGLTDRTIDKYVAMLEVDGLIEKKKRKTKGTNHYMSNLYQILLPTKIAKIIPLGNENTGVGENKVGIGGERNIPITESNINYTNLTTNSKGQQVAKSVPFSFKVELDKLHNSKWKPNKIFALYLVEKGLVFNSREKLELEKNINIKALRKLDAYKGIELKKAMQYCNNNYFDVGWNCHTIVKIIGRVVNNKK